jgi:Gas vesicle synthesis protein GvpL/GvpF
MRKDRGEGQRTMEPSKIIYLYGVVDHPNAPASFAEHKAPPGVRCLPMGELGALVRDVPLQEFGEEALQVRMKDSKWLEEQIWNHARVLEAAMSMSTVIPMKLLTIFRTEESLLVRLSALDESLRTLLARLQGKEEWGVKSFCDLPIIQESVEAQDNGLRQLKAQFAGKPIGTAYLMQKHYEELVRRESTLRLAVHLTSISSRLSALAQEAKFNPPAQESSVHPMVLNTSLLINKSAVSSLENEVNALRQEYLPRGFAFELVGPFPPYSFSALPLGTGHREGASPEGAVHA